MKDYHHGDLKNQLIEKAIFLIDSEGFEKLTIRSVAALCNVSHTAPYRHFKNKEMLIESVIEKIMTEFYFEMEAVYKKHEMDHDLIRYLGICYVDFFVANSQYLKILFSKYKFNFMDFSDETFLDSVDRPIHFLKMAVAKTLKIEDPDKLNYTTLFLWCSVHGLATLLVQQSAPFDSKERERLVKNIIYNGLCKYY